MFVIVTLTSVSSFVIKLPTSVLMYAIHVMIIRSVTETPSFSSSAMVQLLKVMKLAFVSSPRR